MKKEEIDAIVVHCSATPEDKDYDWRDINQMHVKRGFKCIGYNYIITLDGRVQTGRSLTIAGAHCQAKGFSGISYNKHSIGICYIGGLDKKGKAKDTRTPEQKKALREFIAKLVKEYPTIKEIIGHRDASPDLDGDGEVEPFEWVKMCPCFNAKEEYKDML